MDFGNRLKEYRKKNNLTQKELAQIINVSVKTISAYENKENRPTYNDFIKMCNKLKVDAHYFMKDELKYIADSLSKEDQCVLDAYNNLSASNRRVVDFILFTDTPNNSHANIVTYRFPVYDQKAAAGAGILGRDGEYQMEDIVSDNVPSGAVYGVRIRGISMSPGIPDGSLVLVDPKFNEYDVDDKIVIANFKGEVICKRIKIRENYIWFSSDNKECVEDDRKAYSEEEYQINGIVVKVIQ